MRTLYVSDLDGTLLGPDATLSPYATDALNRCIKSGLHFTIATARTYATVEAIMRRVGLCVPIILMNGVLVYDPCEEQYIHQERFAPDIAGAVVEAMRRHDQSGFMYGLQEGVLCTYYERLAHAPLRAFCEERERLYHKVFTPMADFGAHGGEILYFTWIDVRARLQGLYEALCAIPGVGAVLYQDIYAQDLWYLECYSAKASKYHAAQFLRARYGYGRLIGFGDNLNDIPLFEACDERYAVSNAREELKRLATAVIGGNATDGVAHFLADVAQQG